MGIFAELAIKELELKLESYKRFLVLISITPEELEELTKEKKEE